MYDTRKVTHQGMRVTANLRKGHLNVKLPRSTFLVEVSCTTVQGTYKIALDPWQTEKTSNSWDSMNNKYHDPTVKLTRHKYILDNPYGELSTYFREQLIQAEHLDEPDMEPTRGLWDPLPTPTRRQRPRSTSSERERGLQRKHQRISREARIRAEQNKRHETSLEAEAGGWSSCPNATLSKAPPKYRNKSKSPQKPRVRPGGARSESTGHLPGPAEKNRSRSPLSRAAGNQHPRATNRESTHTFPMPHQGSTQHPTQQLPYNPDQTLDEQFLEDVRHLFEDFDMNSPTITPISENLIDLETLTENSASPTPSSSSSVSNQGILESKFQEAWLTYITKNPSAVSQLVQQDQEETTTDSQDTELEEGELPPSPPPKRRRDPNCLNLKLIRKYLDKHASKRK